MATADFTAFGSSTASFVTPGSVFTIQGRSTVAFVPPGNGKTVLSSSGAGAAFWAGRRVVAGSSIRSARFDAIGTSRAAFASGMSGEAVIRASIGRALTMTATVSKAYGIASSMRAV